MRKRQKNRNYGVLLVIWTAVYIIMLGVFGYLMMNAEFGTEQRKAYQTWFTYSNYFGITGAVIIGLFWFFNAPKRKQVREPN